MNQDLVIVKSKTINNESVPIIIKIAEVKHGEIMDQREISRSYVFEDFEAEIPLKYARILVKQNPNEFSIDRAVGEEPTDKVKKAIKSSKQTAEGFKCDICGKDDIKSKAGLTAHLRYNHSEEFAKKYPTKIKKDSK